VYCVHISVSDPYPSNLHNLDLIHPNTNLLTPITPLPPLHTSLSLSLRPSVSLSVCVPVCVCLGLLMSRCVCFSILYMCLLVCMSDRSCVSLFVTVYLPPSLSVYLSMCLTLSQFLSLCLSVLGSCPGCNQQCLVNQRNHWLLKKKIFRGNVLVLCFSQMRLCYFILYTSALSFFLGFYFF
jgi:hypothetical protein